MTGHVLGIPGGGLEDARWARNAAVAKIGQAGEVRTAALLDRFAHQRDGVTVLHDLRIPVPNVTANIDHVVVSGTCVHIIDSKVWKPGRYWTVGGRTRRGFSRFEPAEKKTMAMAHDVLARYLFQHGVEATVAVPVLAVWPSSARQPLKLGWLRVPGARSMTGAQFGRFAKRHYSSSGRMSWSGGRPADPGVVDALAPLLVVSRQQVI